MSTQMRADHWRSLGYFAASATGDRATLLVLHLLRATGSTDTRESVSAWLGLIASLVAPVSDAIRHGVERDLLAVLRRSSTQWWVRREIISFAATEARFGRLALSALVVRQFIVIGERDRFQPVCFHAERLRKSFVV